MNCILRCFIIILMMITAVNCGQERFTPQQGSSSYTINRQSSNPNLSSCSNLTYVRPKVDFLFLLDNSHSSTFITKETMKALNNTINLISGRFDYHILMAPLLVPRDGDKMAFMSFAGRERGGFKSTDLSKASQKFKEISDNHGKGSSEPGVQRTIDLLTANKNGIFRAGANTIIVLMSNGDDNRWESSETGINDAYKKLNEIKKSLNSQQFRFISITPHDDSCSSNTTPKNRGIYRRISKKFHYDLCDIQGCFGVKSTSSKDAYDLCDIQDFTKLFDGINNSIEDTIRGHVYDHWPVAGRGVGPIDEKKIIVKKSSCPDCTDWKTITNFTYIHNTTKKTRKKPSRGESFTGHLIELHGDAQVKYPECMSVSTKTPKEYYRYVWLKQRPLEKSIKLTINGKSIPKSSQDGWELMKGYKHNFQIQITGPKNFKQIGPERSGHFLKLYGSAIYSNGAVVKVRFLPASR